MDDLIAACRTGKYNTVIDILEDNYSSTSVGPNSSNEVSIILSLILHPHIRFVVTVWRDSTL